MFLIGLTGGIAAGKSTVAELWESLGAIHIDADILARDAVAPGSPALDEIAARFGADLIKKDGSLDRTKTAELIFSDASVRSELEAIIHPRVRELMIKKMASLPENSIVVYNVPLLAEAASELPFNRVVTVEAPVEKQVERMVTYRGMSETDANARIQAQASPAQRAAHADYILNSNQDLALLLRDARELWQKLAAEAQESFPNANA
jgi:dephospho-CoA kinase